MRVLKDEKGLTLIEAVLTSTFVTFLILGSINLMSSVYKGITAAKLKTVSLNVANENIEILRNYGFSALPVCPDDSGVNIPCGRFAVCLRVTADPNVCRPVATASITL